MKEVGKQEDNQSEKQDILVVKYARSFEELMRREKQVPKLMIPRWREKPLFRVQVPVPQTDTGRWGENPKTIGRSVVKELGKLTP
jgi:hypothetical protein